MYDAALHVLKNKMSVREVEAYVRELNGGKKKHVRREKVKDPWIRDLEYRLSGKLGTKVEVTGKALSVSYSSTDDLNRILELLGCLEEQES
jgi:ParB family chromosome partitioning protein